MINIFYSMSSLDIISLSCNIVFLEKVFPKRRNCTKYFLTESILIDATSISKKRILYTNKRRMIALQRQRITHRQEIGFATLQNQGSDCRSATCGC